MPHPLNFYIDKSGNIYLPFIGVSPTSRRVGWWEFCFCRPFADGIFVMHRHKAYHFSSLTGKITKVSGKYPVKGKTLGKNKSDKRQDKRQQNSCKLTKFRDSPQIFRGELKIKKYRKRNKNTNHFWGWQNIGRKIFLEDLWVLSGNHLFDCFYNDLTVVTKVNICMVYIC